MKKLISGAVLFMVVCSIAAQTPTLRSTSIVKDFFSKVNIYASDDDPAIHSQLLQMCSSGFIASDQCSLENTKIQSSSIDLESFLLLFREVKAKIEITSIKEVKLYIPRTLNGAKAIEIKCNITSPIDREFRYTNLHNIVYVKDGKVFGIGDYMQDTRKIEDKVELRSFKFSTKDVEGKYNSTRVTEAHKGDIASLYCELNLWSNRQMENTTFLHKIYRPNGELWVINGEDNVPSGTTMVSNANVPVNEVFHHSYGIGCSTGGCWSEGKYRWEVWTTSGMLGYQYFEILPPQPNPIPKRVSFACSYYTGGDYDEKLFQEEVEKQYLFAKILFNKTAKTRTDVRIEIFNPKGERCVISNATLVSGKDVVEVSCSNRYYSSGTYSYKVYMGNKAAPDFKGTFYLNPGKGVQLSSSELTFYGSNLHSKEITVNCTDAKNELTIKPEWYSSFKCSAKGSKIRFKPSWFSTSDINETWTITNKSNGEKKKLHIKQYRATGDYYPLADYIEEYGRYRLEFATAKMFAGWSVWGAEFSVCDLRLSLAGLSLAHFGVKSSLDLQSYQVYYSPQVSAILPFAVGELGHAFYLSAGPTIELYRSPKSTFRPYWFTAEMGYRMTVYLTEYEFFVKYIDGFAAGITFRIGLDWDNLD